ncbi:hypothetical protein KRX51_02155 [Corynebacterium sp. TAE3-ERU12]|uniref:TetR/AcrR family transcriptional regulator n=1 Tax=Corynebacterium sp. TAE3-ERU12 TaxID=2849491 RepID=UPI001C45CE9A|nr:hypothetical protein [Corynebacterium sp. TAE3-ERU12]MBV7294722.1 hypothetical protein [Corynebacterium sp. TAE3-ERU12]
MSPTSSRPSRRPGPKPTFTLDDAIDAALEEGIRDFTIGSVAKRLGVAPSALYRVTEDRRALVGAILDRLAQELQPSSHDLPWQDQIRGNAAELWRLVNKHEGLAMVLLTLDIYDNVRDPLANIVTGLVKGGLKVYQALFLLDLVAETTLVSSVNYAPLKRRTASFVRESLADNVSPEEIRSLAGDAEVQLKQKIEYLIIAMENGLLEPAVVREREQSERMVSESPFTDQ